ncbi:MAG: alpha/beta hydrolase [Planctomycetota bacterium]
MKAEIINHGKMHTSPLTWLFRALRSIILIVLLALLLLYIFQGRLIFFPTSSIESNPAEYGMDYEDVSFMSADGTKLTGWYIRAQSPRGWVLFCHGNGGNISHRLGNAEFLVKKMSLNVLLFDYRGYGESEGSPDEQGLYDDTLAAWKWLTTVKSAQPASTVIYGRSLGGGPAAWLAWKESAGALVLESTFSSLAEQAQRTYPFLPVKLLLRYHFDSISRVPYVGEPVMVIHSPQDDVIPFDLGQKLYEAANTPKYFVEISGSHNSGNYLYSQEYFQGWSSFLDRHLKKPSNSAQWDT